MPPMKVNPLDAARKIAADAARERSEIADVVKRLDMLNRAMVQIGQEVSHLAAELRLRYGQRGGMPSGERIEELLRPAHLSAPDPRLDDDIPY